MSNSTVEQFAAELKKPVGELLEQLRSAGVDKHFAADGIIAGDKEQLLAYLRKEHDALVRAAAPSASAARNRAQHGRWCAGGDPPYPPPSGGSPRKQI